MNFLYKKHTEEDKKIGEEFIQNFWNELSKKECEKVMSPLIDKPKVLEIMAFCVALISKFLIANYEIKRKNTDERIRLPEESIK